MVLLSERLRRTKCPKGHILGPYNRSKDGRCLVCHRIDMRLRRARTPKRGIPNKDKTHCPQGHPYSGKNLSIITRPGRQPGTYYKTRICLTCKAARSMHRYWTKVKRNHPGERGRPQKIEQPENNA